MSISRSIMWNSNTNGDDRFRLVSETWIMTDLQCTVYSCVESGSSLRQCSMQPTCVGQCHGIYPQCSYTCQSMCSHWISSHWTPPGFQGSLSQTVPTVHYLHSTSHGSEQQQWQLMHLSINESEMTELAKQISIWQWPSTILVTIWYNRKQEPLPLTYKVVKKWALSNIIRVKKVSNKVLCDH